MSLLYEGQFVLWNKEFSKHFPSRLKCVQFMKLSQYYLWKISHNYLSMDMCRFMFCYEWISVKCLISQNTDEHGIWNPNMQNSDLDIKEKQSCAIVRLSTMKTSSKLMHGLNAMLALQRNHISIGCPMSFQVLHLQVLFNCTFYK